MRLFSSSDIKILTWAALFLLLSFSAAANGDINKKLSAILDSQIVNELEENGKAVRIEYGSKQNLTNFTPKFPAAEKIAEKSTGRELFSIESFYLYKKQNKEAPSISKILHSLSSLEGLEYYSHRRKKMRLLYKKSYAVTKETDKHGKVFYKEAPDPIEISADGLKILVCQEDLTFGKYIYEYEFFEDESSAGMSCTNIETLKYSLLKVIKPFDLRVSFAVNDMGSHLLVYGRAGAVFTKLPGLEKKLTESFSSRADAIYNWFINQYNAEGKY